jgi:hypothetical protein
LVVSLPKLLHGATIMLRSEDENHEVAILVSNRKEAKDLMVALLAMSLPEAAREKLGKTVRIRRG